MTCIHHYSIRQNSFTALKFLCALPFLHPSHQPLATTDPFAVPMGLRFPEYHIDEIKEYVAFSEWFLSLSSIY